MTVNESSVEVLIDELAQRIGYNVIKESNLTGYTYTLINKDDTWFYLLNHYEGTAH